MEINYPWMFIAGILVILLLLYWRLKDIIVLPGQWQEAEGIIVNWMSREEKGKRFFHPMIEFKTLDGHKTQYRAEDHSENAPMYPIGTKVTVKYNKKNPKQVKTVYPKKK